MSYVDPFSSFNAPGSQQQQNAQQTPFTPYTPPPIIHPQIMQAATTPGMALTAGQIGQLQGQSQPTATLPGQPAQPPQPTLAQQQQAGGPAANSPPGGLFGVDPNATDPTSKKYMQALAQQGMAPGPKKGTPAQQQYQQLLSQWNQTLGSMGVAGLTAGQVQGPAGQALAQKLAAIAAKMPNSQATSLIGQLPKNLQTLVNGYIAQPPAPTSSASQQQSAMFDPLALQTMWKDVFGPALQSSKSLLQNTGSDYISAMTDVINQSNLPQSQKNQQLAEAKATGSMEQQLAGDSYSAAISKIPYDYITQALSTAAAQAQLAREASERAVAYGVGQTAASGAGASGATGTQISNALIGLGITGPSQ